MTSILTTFEHNLIIARNGQEAVEMAKTHKPDLIFMDIRMPEMNGIEATKLLRDLEIFKDLPIIALTASTGPDAIEEHMAAGFNNHLSKPIILNLLFKLLNEYLGDDKSDGDSLT
jgi:two-component system, NarL family, sensor histidine kinase BarA